MEKTTKPEETEREDTHSQPAKSNKGLIITLIVVIVLAIVGLVGTWYYMYNQQQNKSQEYQKKIDELEAKLESQIQNNESNNSSPDSTGVTVVRIPEMSLQYPINNDTSGLLYYADCNTTNCTLWLSDVTLVSQAEKLDASSKESCSAPKGPLGYIKRYRSGEVVATSDKAVETFPTAKKIGVYYYLYTGPQATCSNDLAVAELQKSLIPKAEKLVQYLGPLK